MLTAKAVIVCFLFNWVENYAFCSTHAYTFILDNMILYGNKISILIVIADLEGFIQTIQSYLCTINSIAGMAT